MVQFRLHVESILPCMHEFSAEVVSTALKNLFEDGSLKSQLFSNELIKYDYNLCNLMSTADVKWVSNDRLIFRLHTRKELEERL